MFPIPLIHAWIQCVIEILRYFYLYENIELELEHIDGLVQNCSNSIANALKLLQSCAKPSIWLTRLRTINAYLKSSQKIPTNRYWAPFNSHQFIKHTQREEDIIKTDPTKSLSIRLISFHSKWISFVKIPPGHCFNIKTVFPGIGISIMKTWQEWYCLVFIMEIPIWWEDILILRWTSGFLQEKIQTVLHMSTFSYLLDWILPFFILRWTSGSLQGKIQTVLDTSTFSYLLQWILYFSARLYNI